MSQPELILASASPRRRELLAQLGVAFDVQASALEEPTHKPAAVSPGAWVEALAYYKARSVADRDSRRWVLGADTIVVCGNELLGKPRDRNDARRMLARQAAVVSDVLTGVCLVRASRGIRRFFGHVGTRVWMRDDPAAREAYLAGGHWRGKAGAYGIQDAGDELVRRWEGSFSNVMGLPKGRIRTLLDQAGLT